MIMFYIFVTLRATYTILASYTYDLIRGLGPINSLFYKSLVLASRITLFEIASKEINNYILLSFA